MSFEMKMHFGTGSPDLLPGPYTPGENKIFFATDQDGNPAYFLDIKDDLMTGRVLVSHVPSEQFVTHKNGRVLPSIPRDIKPFARLESGESVLVELPFSAKAGQRVLEISNVPRPQ